MSYRNSQVFISSVTKRRLYLVTELYPQETTNFKPGLIQHDTGYAGVDECADKLLNETIERSFPLVLELEKKQEALTKEFIKLSQIPCVTQS